MNILILGASSAIGHAITEQFASGNHLLLLGRKETLLTDLAATACHTALSANVLTFNLSTDTKPIQQAISDFSPDLIIWASSITSQLRDSATAIRDMRTYAMADLVSPLELLDTLLAQSTKKINVIFISTLLTLIQSPDRAIYSSLKTLSEASLVRLQQQYPDTLHVVITRICALIPSTHASPKAQKMAKDIMQAYQQGISSINLGASGKLLLALHKIHPTFTHLLLLLQRKIRQWHKKG